MTAPVPSLSQQRAFEHARKAAELADQTEQDQFLAPGQASVVAAYRALAHALLATWTLNMPDSVLAALDPNAEMVCAASTV